MASPLSKELLTTVSSSAAELAAVVFTVIGALSGAIYVVASKPLRKIEAQERLVLEGKVATAQSEAARATEGVAIANKGAADANKEAARANKRTGILTVKANELAVTAKSLELQVEQERMARLKIEQYFLERQISDAQAATLVEKLKSLRGGKVGLFVITGNPEICIW